MKKNFITLSLIILLAGLTLFTACGNTDTTKTTDSTPSDITDEYKDTTLVVSIWSSKIEIYQPLLDQFAELYGCNIVIDEAVGNADRLNKIISQKSSPTIDVALLEGSYAEKGNTSDAFAKINTSIVANTTDLYSFAQQKESYGPGYSFVLYGLVYDADEVSAPTTYLDLFEKEEYQGKIAVPDINTPAGISFLITLAEALGGSIDNIDPAIDYLAKHKDDIALYYTSSLEALTAFTNESVVIAVLPNGSLPTLINAGINAQWAELTDGYLYEVSTVNIVKNCANPGLAQEFVKFLLSEEIQSKLAGTIMETPANMKAVITEEQEKYFSFSSDMTYNLRSYDSAKIDKNKANWITVFNEKVLGITQEQDEKQETTEKDTTNK